MSACIFYVSLRNNRITNAGVRALSAGASLSAKLEYMDVVGNPGVDEREEVALEEVLSHLRGGSRNHAYREMLAFMGAAVLARARGLGPGLEREGATVTGTAATEASTATPARRFVEACGDRAVLRLIVGMLVG